MYRRRFNFVPSLDNNFDQLTWIAHLSQVLICDIHDFLGCPWTFDWGVGEREDGVPFSEGLQLLERFRRVLGRIVGANAGCVEGLRQTLDLK